MTADQPAVPPTFPRLFVVLSLLLLAGIVIAAFVILVVDPGEGQFSVGGAVIGLLVAVVVLALVVLALLVNLAKIQRLVKMVYPGEDGARAAALRAENPGAGAGGAVRSMTQIGKAEEAQHVLLIEGIGEKYATRLNNHGIITIPQLVQANPDRVADAIEVTPGVVREWQAMGRLMQVKGIGPQFAEVLARIGITGAEDLSQADPMDITTRITRLEEGRKVRIQGGDVSPARVQRWVDAAASHLQQVRT